ncbi:MAG: hypothetical protein AB8I69_19660, partial [Anaerolineae bacterium]
MLGVCGVVLALALVAAQTAVAQTTWTVTSTADDGSSGTLRDALNQAADGDTIDLTGVSGTIALNSTLGIN